MPYYEDLPRRIAKKKKSSDENVKKPPVYRENFECVLIRTIDNRGFFVFKRHLHHLVGFARKFQATMSIVKIQRGNILNLAEFVESFNDKAYSAQEIEFKVIQEKFPVVKKKTVQPIGYIGQTNSRQEILDRAASIKSFINKELILGQAVSISTLQRHFREYNLKRSTFYRYIRIVRASLSKNNIQTKLTLYGYVIV